MYLVSLHLCAAHTLHCLAGYLFFSLPTTNNFFKFVYSEITAESAWLALFRPSSLAIEGHQNLTHIDSGHLISRTFLPRAGSSCTLLCLYLVSCAQKMRWRAHSLADIVPPFLTILQFSSEPSNNWGTGLSSLRPLWIYCTSQQYKAPLFPCLFSCLSSLCLQLLHYGSYLSFTQVLSFCTCTIMSVFFWNADFPYFKCLPSPSRSCGIPLLALLVP